MKIMIIGNGGHSKVIKDLITSLGTNELIGYLDDKYQEFTMKKELLYGPLSAAHIVQNRFPTVKFIIGIGNNLIRKTVSEQLELTNDDYISLIHPTAWVSPSATVRAGSVIMANAVIQADVKIGSHTIINTSAIVEHDNKLGPFVHLSPNAVLTGSDWIDEGVHIGAGATVIPHKKIGKWATVGAGATVIHDLPDGCTAVGIPAKVITHQPAGGV